MKIMKKRILFLLAVVALQTAAAQSWYDDVLKAVILSEKDDAAAAAGVIAGVTQVNSDADLLVLRGQIYLKASMLKEAETDFMRAESIKQGAGVYGLARCAAMRGELQKTITLLERHLRSPERKSEPEIMLDPLFNSVNRTAEWRALWRQEWYKGYERMGWEIDHYLKSGKIDEASEVFDKLSSVYPDLTATDYYRARIMISRGRPGDAAQLLTALTTGRDAPVNWLYDLAEARRMEGGYAATAVYERMIDARVPDPGLLLKKALVMAGSGDRPGARRELLRYLAIDPDNTEALGMTGRLFAEEGEIYQALPYLNENVEKHPGEPLAFSLRGDAWLAARTWDKAAEDYSMSLDLEPDNGIVNLNLGIALVNDGRSADACYYLRKARSLGVKEATEYLARYCVR